jgi:hypothetical protein
MDYLKGRLELIEARKNEVVDGNGKIVEYSSRIMEHCQRHLSAFTAATDDRTKRLLNVIMGYTATILTNATSVNISLLNFEDNMKEVYKCIDEMESEKK